MFSPVQPMGSTSRLRPGAPTLRQAQEELYARVIDKILESDLNVAKKQRHTVKRIFERLRDECGFDGGYTTVKDYVREHRRLSREMFVPLSHTPGQAQCDFSEVLVIIGGVRPMAYYFILELPHSDGCFVKAYPAETTKAFLHGHVSAFGFLGGVPQSILYDNTRLAVARILGDGHQRMVERRIRAARFPAVKSLDTFDFLVIPSVNKVLVAELARCENVERRENVIAVGNSGTGKTHVALGLGLAACHRGMSVGVTTAAGLVPKLMEGSPSNTGCPFARWARHGSARIASGWTQDQGPNEIVNGGGKVFHVGGLIC